MHNRLDLKLSSLEFTDAKCGSLNLLTQKREYCGDDCPVKKGKEPEPELTDLHKKLAGLPHNSRKARQQELGSTEED